MGERSNNNNNNANKDFDSELGQKNNLNQVVDKIPDVNESNGRKSNGHHSYNKEDLSANITYPNISYKDKQLEGEQDGRLNAVQGLNRDLLFTVASKPPIHVGLAYALQQASYLVPACASGVLVIAGVLCAHTTSGHPLATMMSSAVFMSGLATLIQSTLGVRLPLLQGSAVAFITSIVAVSRTNRWKCMSHGFAAQNRSLLIMDQDELFRSKIQELSGGLILASLAEVAIGCTGAIGLLMSSVGPLTITPTVTLVALSLSGIVADHAGSSWLVTLFGIVLICLFSLVLNEVQVPLPMFSMDTGFYWKRMPIFKIFAPILALAIAWIVCHICTLTDFFSDDPSKASFKARTDYNLKLVTKAKWFYFPYPGQFGMPTFGVHAFAAFIAVTISSIVESAGDYHACASISRLPPPPRHAINRGIMAEGISSVISGFMGVCHGTTSYSGSMGYIGATGMASLRTFQLTGVLMMVLAVFGKFAAILTMIPVPVVAMSMVVGLGMVISIALTNLEKINLRHPRSLIILGTAFMLGVSVPNWIEKNPTAIDTGHGQLDQVVTILLHIPMFIGGATAFLMDNLLPGSRRLRGFTDSRGYAERGVVNAKEGVSEAEMGVSKNPERGGDVGNGDGGEKSRETTCAEDELSYDIFSLGERYAGNAGLLRFVPFLPTYKPVPWPRLSGVLRSCRRRLRSGSKNSVDIN